MLVIANIVASLEHHMFKKVSEPAFTNFLSCRTDMISNVHMYYRIRMIFVNDNRKAVWQNIFFIRNYNFITFFYYFFHKLSLRKNQYRYAKQHKGGQQIFFHTLI